MDIENGVGFNQKNSPHLADLVTINNLKDVFRSFYPTNKEFTFFRSSAAPSRLDGFYVAGDLLPQVCSVEHIASLSDHCGVKMDMKLNISASTRSLKQGRKTYWKINNNILKDEDFLDNFLELWNWLLLQKPAFSDVADWWDKAAKPSIKEFCILFSSRRTRIRNDSKRFWFSYLKIVLKLKN